MHGSSVFGKHVERLLTTAAGLTLDRIAADRRRSGLRVRALLGYIEEHLFDQEFSFKEMARSCGVRDNSIGTVFSAQLGVPPRDYLALRRLDVALRLLRDSDLPIAQVAEIVGYSSPDVFRRAFKRHFSLAPGEFRRKIRDVAARVPPPTVELLSVDLLDQVHAGALDRHRAGVLIRYLQTVFGREDGTQEPGAGLPAPVLLRLDRRLIEEVMAHRVWRAIEELPHDRQRAAVRQAGFTTSALFDLLRKKSREIGCRDRRRGVELAELAVASLEADGEAFGAALPGLQALGWAWVGNARRVDHDLAGAEQAFALAEAAWGEPGRPRDPLLEGQILDMKASLRLYQRCHREALKLVGRAISDFERAGDTRLLAKALILRASIYTYMGQHAAPVGDLKRALGALNPRQRRLRLNAFQALATTHAQAGDPKRAARSLRRAQELCATQDEAVVRLQLTWVDGVVRRASGQVMGAERCFRHAQAGFSALEEIGYATVVGLDLAVLCAEQGRSAEAVALAAETVPAFEALRIHREAVAALELLQPALAAGELPLAVLRRVREHFERLRRDPAVRFRAEV